MAERASRAWSGSLNGIGFQPLTAFDFQDQQLEAEGSGPIDLPELFLERPHTGDPSPAVLETAASIVQNALSRPVALMLALEAYLRPYAHYLRLSAVSSLGQRDLWCTYLTLDGLRVALPEVDTTRLSRPHLSGLFRLV